MLLALIFLLQSRALVGVTTNGATIASEGSVSFTSEFDRIHLPADLKVRHLGLGYLHLMEQDVDADTGEGSSRADDIAFLLNEAVCDT